MAEKSHSHKRKSLKAVTLLSIHFASDECYPAGKGISKGIRRPTSSMSISTWQIWRYCVVASNDALGEEVSFRAVPGTDLSGARR